MAPDIVSHLSPPRPHVTLSLRSAPLLTTLAFLVLLLVPCAVAQNTPDDLAGIREGSPYNVSDFDAVNVATGSLTLHIPLLSYPQRGALKVEYELLYNGQMTQQQTSCDERQGTCNPPLFSWSLLPRGVYANEVNQPNVNSKLIRFIWPNVTTYNYSAYIRTVREADGATHILGNMGTNALPPGGGLIIESGPWRALDGTGWELLTDGITLISSAGVRFAGGGTDTNGNQIQYTTSGITDTLGRQLPPLPSSTSASNTDASGCTGPLATTSAVLWSPPALQGGTANYKFCYATVQVFAKAYEASNGATFPQVMLQSVVLRNGTTWTFEYSDRNSGDASTVNYGSLTTIPLPTGGTVSYTYADGSMFAWGENCGIQQLSTTSVSRWVTSKTVTDQTGAHTWTYGGGKVAAPDGSSTVHQFIVDYQGTPHETGTPYYNTSGTLLKNVQTTYNTPVTTCYQGVVNYLPLTRTTTLDNSQVTKETYTYDTGFTFLDLLGSPRSYAANYGKVTSTTAYDYGNPSAGAPLRTTNTSYAWQNPNPNYSTYLSNNLLNLSSQVAVFSGTSSSGACGANGSVACTTYGSDEATVQSSRVRQQHVAGQAYAGNQTSVHRWLNGSTVAQAPCNISVSNGYLVSNNVYYDTGELQKSTDPCLYSTTFQYNSASPFFGAYLTKLTTALNQTTAYGDDSNTAVVTSITDPNSQTTIKTYDNMERLATVTYPSSDASGNGGGTATYTYTDTPGSLSLEVKRSIDGTRSTDEVALFDGLGREISLSKANGEITPWDKTDICYDARGLKNFVSYPYQAPSYNTTQVCAGAGDSYTYDALNRVTSVTHSDGSAVSTAYSGAAARVTDEGNGTSPVQRISQVDGLGRLIAVCEMSATTLQYGLSPTPTNPCNSFFTGSGFLTTYQYDGLSNLTNVIQGSLTARKFTYDSLSRLLTASNPESGITCYGTWSSGYNSVCNSGYHNDGNLTQRTMLVPNQAANGTAVVTTTYKYDALNRLGSKSYNDGATLGSYYYYDQTTAFGKSLSHGIGRLTSEGIYNGTTWVNSAEFGYDPMGRIVFDGQNIPSQYNLSYGYDYAGDVTSMTNGAGVTFSPTYNVARRLL